MIFLALCCTRSQSTDELKKIPTPVCLSVQHTVTTCCLTWLPQQ